MASKSGEPSEPDAPQTLVTETTRAELVDDLRAMGVESRHVMIHSSYKAIRPVEGGPAGVVEAFVEAVGDGVLLYPCFDFASWSEGGYWDRQLSPSRMGAISEAARADARFVRSGHPMLSFAVNGDLIRKAHWDGPYPESNYFEEENHGYLENPPNAHGAGSVFDRFVQNDGLLLSFSGEGFRPGGVDVGYTLSVHSAVLAEVDWRFTKVFQGTYVDNGIASIRKYSASVCRRDRFATEVTAGHIEAEKQGVIRRYKFGRVDCLVASAREFHAFAVESHRTAPHLWRRELT